MAKKKTRAKKSSSNAINKIDNQIKELSSKEAREEKEKLPVVNKKEILDKIEKETTKKSNTSSSKKSNTNTTKKSSSKKSSTKKTTTTKKKATSSKTKKNPTKKETTPKKTNRSKKDTKAKKEVSESTKKLNNLETEIRSLYDKVNSVIEDIDKEDQLAKTTEFSLPKVLTRKDKALDRLDTIDTSFLHKLTYGLLIIFTILFILVIGIIIFICTY